MEFEKLYQLKEKNSNILKNDKLTFGVEIFKKLIKSVNLPDVAKSLTIFK